MLDYNPPHQFPPSDTPRGVDVHPHKGFETVTIVLEGEMAHSDSTGSHGVIGPNEVQWMTAGAGILHKEFQTPEFAASGMTQHLLQLWVNLPAKHKNHPPRYQSLTKDNIPVIEEGKSKIRVLAGSYADQKGSAETFTPITLLDIQLAPGRAFGMPMPADWNSMVLVVEGDILYAGKTKANVSDFLIFESEGEAIALEAGDQGARLILMAGEPIREPIAAYGPFVMNTQREIMEAIESFQRGDFGQLS
jgi:redox-sensitive bicupin YhaK (pirin superfamily)